jgi:hypothetical protein
LAKGTLISLLLVRFQKLFWTRVGLRRGAFDPLLHAEVRMRCVPAGLQFLFLGAAAADALGDLRVGQYDARVSL